jgi:hypothetical protein
MAKPWRFNERCWSIRDSLGWLYEPDPARFGRIITIQHLRAERRCYSGRTEEKPERALLVALRRGYTRSFRTGQELPPEYWNTKTLADLESDVETRLPRADVLALRASDISRGADWSSLFGALAYIGTPDESDAKSGICDLIANHKIGVLVTLDTQETFSAQVVEVPQDLLPEDIDWPRSRPFKAWFVAGAARPIDLVEIDADALRALKLRQQREQSEAKQDAEEAPLRDRLDRPWWERDIFGAFEIGDQFAREPGSVDVDTAKRARVILTLVNWAHRGEGDFICWRPPEFRPFGPSDNALFPADDPDLALNNAGTLFATRATAKRFFRHYEKPFPAIWSVTGKSEVTASRGKPGPKPEKRTSIAERMFADL